MDNESEWTLVEKGKKRRKVVKQPPTTEKPDKENKTDESTVPQCDDNPFKSLED